MNEVTLVYRGVGSGVLRSATTLSLWRQLEAYRVMLESIQRKPEWTRANAVHLCDLIDGGHMLNAGEMADLMGFDFAFSRT